MHNINQRLHRLFKRRHRIRAMGIENIHIFKLHTLQTAVERSYEILPGAPFSIRSRPHVMSGFCGNDYFITVLLQHGGINLAEQGLCRTIWRPIIICEVKVGNPLVESIFYDAATYFEVGLRSEIMPEAQGDLRK